MAAKDTDNKPCWMVKGIGIASLTQEDRRQVRLGFELFYKNKVANGARFFSRFFKNNPSYQELFPALHGVDPDQIKTHRFLICVHVERFFYIFEEFLSNMYNAEGLHMAVYGMLNSKTHIKIHLRPKHCQDMLTAILETIVEILKEESVWSPEIELSWKKFMVILYEIMLQEINEAENINQANRHN